MNMNKAELDEAFEKAAAESTKKMGEILDKVSALVNGIAADVKSFGEAKFRREVIKEALKAAQGSHEYMKAGGFDAEQVSRYALAVADKLAPLAPPPPARALTNDEAARVQANIR